jgi:hypothetical protein
MSRTRVEAFEGRWWRLGKKGWLRLCAYVNQRKTRWSAMAWSSMRIVGLSLLAAVSVVYLTYRLEVFWAQSQLWWSAGQIIVESKPRAFTRHIVAVGDLHGDLPNAERVLRFSGVVNDYGDWSGQVDFFVQTGDIIDR